MKQDALGAWEQVLSYIRREIDPESFETYFSRCRLESLQAGQAVVRFPSTRTRDDAETRFRSLLEHHLSQASGQSVEIRFVAASRRRRPEGAGESGSRAPSVAAPSQPATPALLLNPGFTFENFVVGEGNKLAAAYARAVAEKPAGCPDKPRGEYNPFFLYGASGLGKTHLLHAIGHHIKLEYPQLRVVYLSAEQFLSEYVDAIRSNNCACFQSRYRYGADVLLMDDIHFLASKERTQEEFFHTFNTLHNYGKQIVLTSDRSPRDIAIAERLKTRFAGGLVADIGAPDLETREAILRLKCEQEGEYLHPEVLVWLARSVRSSVRELEGALIRLLAHTKVTGQRLSLDLAREMLQGMIAHRDRDVPMDRIIKCVAARYRVKAPELLGSRRSRTVTVPRRIAMYLCRQLTDHSYPEIGAHFGGKDHSTVIHACRKVEREMEASEEFAHSIESLCSILRHWEI